MADIHKYSQLACNHFSTLQLSILGVNVKDLCRKAFYPFLQLEIASIWNMIAFPIFVVATPLIDNSFR